MYSFPVMKLRMNEKIDAKNGNFINVNSISFHHTKTHHFIFHIIIQIMKYERLSPHNRSEYF